MSVPTADQPPIVRWLTRGHSCLPQALAEWKEMGVAMLPLGEQCAAIRMRVPMVRAAMGKVESQDGFTEALAVLLGGPVIHDGAAQCFYALVPPDAGGAWQYQDRAPFMRSDDTTLVFLGVPRVDRTTPPYSYWVIPPQIGADGAVPLCDVAAVSALVEMGRAALAATEVQRAYRIYLGHVADCAVCRVDKRCPDGEALAGSLRLARDTAHGFPTQQGGNAMHGKIESRYSGLGPVPPPERKREDDEDGDDG